VGSSLLFAWKRANIFARDAIAANPEASFADGLMLVLAILLAALWMVLSYEHHTQERPRHRGAR